MLFICIFFILFCVPSSYYFSPDTFQSNIFVLFSVCGKSYYIICMCVFVCVCVCECGCFSLSISYCSFLDQIINTTTRTVTVI